MPPFARLAAGSHTQPHAPARLGKRGETAAESSLLRKDRPSSFWISLLGHDCGVVMTGDTGLFSSLNWHNSNNYTYFCKDEDNAYKVLKPDIWQIDVSLMLP